MNLAVRRSLAKSLQRVKQVKGVSGSAMAPTNRIVIDVVSDTVCPWCYVGKRRLEQAVKQYGSDVEFQVNWHPFQLNPHASQEGVNKLEYYNSKFGESRVRQMIPNMVATMAAEGVQYSMGGLTGNTLDSHRLIHWAAQFGAQKQNELVEELFKNYFSEEKFINDREVLVAAAEKVGLQGAREYLADPNNGLAEVMQELSTRAKGINGVPNFTIADRYQVSGAQSPGAFINIFDKVLGR